MRRKKSPAVTFAETDVTDSYIVRTQEQLPYCGTEKSAPFTFWVASGEKVC